MAAKEGDKVYKVVTDFKEPDGQAWKAGQVYTGEEQEIQVALSAGHIAEDTSASTKK